MNLDMKIDPLLLITYHGRLNRLVTWSTRSRAHPSDVSVVVGIKIGCFENLSTMVRIASYPCDSGSGLIMSTEIVCQEKGGI